MKKRYRVYKPEILGGSVEKNSETSLQKMQFGGTPSTEQDQVQSFMLMIYQLFKDGMTQEDVENQLLSQHVPQDFVARAIDVVKKYMEDRGEWEEDVELDANLAQTGVPQEQAPPQESELKKQNDVLMNSYAQQASAAALEEDDDAEFDDLLHRENPYMKKGGKVSKRKFMKNVLKRFEDGAENESKLSSGSKTDTLERDVEKVTKGFVGAVQGKAKEATAKELYSLAEQSGDPKLQQILMSGNQQQPMQPMARDGMMVDDNEPIAGQYAEDGVIVDPGGRDYQSYIDWYNEDSIDPETESREAPMSEEEFNQAYGKASTTKNPAYGRTVYRDRYEYTPYGGGYGLRDLLFPANRMFGYRPKYMAPSSWGRPVARDVYKRGILGRPKKWMEYYEVPEDTDLSEAQILRQRDINKAARTMNRGLRKLVRGKGSLYDRILDRFDNDTAIDEAEQEEVNDSPTTDQIINDRRSNREFSRDFYQHPYMRRDLRRRLNKGKTTQQYELDQRDYDLEQRRLREEQQAEMDRIMNFSLGEGEAPFLNTMMDSDVDYDSYASGGQYYYGPGGSNQYAEQMLGYDPGAAKPPFLMEQPSSLNFDYNANPFANDPMRGASSVADDSIVNTSGNVSGVAMTSDGTYEEPGGNLDMDPNKKFTTEEEGDKTKIVGFKNKYKRDLIGGQEFLNPFNAYSNRILGGLENLQNQKAANRLIVDSTDPMNMYMPETYKDRGDWDIYGNFRADEQGFIGSTNNPGMTGQAKYGGHYRKGAVVEMTGPELQQFMAAGGQIEFI